MELGRGERGGGLVMLFNNFCFDCFDVVCVLVVGVIGLGVFLMLEIFNLCDSI